MLLFQVSHIKNGTAGYIYSYTAMIVELVFLSQLVHSRVSCEFETCSNYYHSLEIVVLQCTCMAAQEHYYGFTMLPREI